MQKRVVRASNKKNFVLFWMSIGLSAAAYFGLKYMDLSGPRYYVFAAMLAVFLAFSLYYLATFALALPKISADSRGITLQTLFRKQFWPWEACGRFFLSTLVVPVRYTKHRQYFVCAFTPRTQQAIDVQGAPVRPDHMHADIKIPLHGTKAGASESEASAFVEDLNRMLQERTAHLSPSDAVYPGPEHANALKDLERARKQKHVQYAIAIGIAILVGIAGIVLRLKT